MSPPNIQFIGSSGLVDWDTYEDGIWLVTDFNATSADNAKSQVSVVTSSSFTTPSAGSAGFYNTAIRSRYHSDATTATLPEYLAIWDVSASQWYVKQRNNIFGSAGAYIVNYGTNLYGGTFTPVDGQDYYFVFLTQDPGDITGWRDFDTYTWDTYKDGIYRHYWTKQYSFPYNNVYYGEIEIETPTSYSSMAVGGTYINAESTTSMRMYNPNGNIPFYMLLWNTVNRTWHKCARTASYSGGTQIYYSVTPAMPDPSTAPWEIHNLIWCTQDPGDITYFADYNKPIPWETDANGIWRVNSITWGSSNMIELDASTNGSGTGGVDWQWSYMGGTENCTGNAYSYRYYSNGSGNPTGSVDSATLVTYSLRDRQFTSASAGFCATARFYDAQLSRSDYTAWPQVFILYDRLFEPEELYRLSTYDGPVANWDTYANGVYITDYLLTSGSPLYAIPSYPATTYTDAMTSIWVTAVTGGYVPTSTLYQTNYDGDEPPYIAVYIHEYSDDVENTGGSNAKGWYVFKNDIPSTGTYSRTQWETPIAWPSDVSTSRDIPANEQGFLGSYSGINSGYIVVFLDEYNDPVGSGGTDHWTKPPMVHFGTVDAVNTASNQIGVNWGTYLNLGAYIYSGMENGFDVGAYPYTPIRGTFYGSTTGLFYSALLSNIGMIDFELYTNGTKTHTGILDTSGYTSPASKTSTITDVAYSDFDVYCNNVSIGDEIIAVYYYND